MSLHEKLYARAPNVIQEAFISLYNLKQYNIRHSGQYNHFREAYREQSNLSLEALKEIQKENYKLFVDYIIENSKFYRDNLSAVENPSDINNITKLPVVTKEDIRRHLPDVYTVLKKNSIVAKTGGTTGKSLEVRFTKFDAQERHAVLDNFRGQSGYRLGKKTAWFSGKALLTTRDIRRNRFWKTDHLHKVRYYSTFHIQSKFMRYYLDNLINYKPEYLVGFPSTICDIARFGQKYNIEFPPNVIKAIYPTAETITDEIREQLETYFKTRVFDQYASSEGAPFILECKKGSLHMELRTGVFEVVDENNLPCNNGRLICTPFNTRGTPLLRYDIGDTVELSDDVCDCENNNPVVKSVHGRVSDFVYSPDTGKINLGNISNCLKGVSGVVRFQMQQDELTHLKILVEKDEAVFNDDYESVFIKNIRDRIGDNMTMDIYYVEAIPVEKSGKFRMIKNSIKNQIKV